MKKSAIFILMICAGLCVGKNVFAEDQDYQQPSERRGQGMMMSGESMGGGQGMGMMGGKGMGMKGGPSSMVALMDGSVVVLSGNKLTKYDSDLAVVKEVDIQGGSMPMDKMTRVKKPRPMDEGQMQQPPAELSDSVPAMLEAAATPPPSGDAVNPPSDPGTGQ